MRTKIPDLVKATPDQLRSFVMAVTDLAIADHELGIPEGRRTGEMILNMFVEDWRLGHRRFATGIYNQVRWTMALRVKESGN